MRAQLAGRQHGHEVIHALPQHLCARGVQTCVASLLVGVRPPPPCHALPQGPSFEVSDSCTLSPPQHCQSDAMGHVEEARGTALSRLGHCTTPSPVHTRSHDKRHTAHHAQAQHMHILLLGASADGNCPHLWLLLQVTTPEEPVHGGVLDQQDVGRDLRTWRDCVQQASRSKLGHN